MKSKEVEIGMAVIPHDKTMGYCNFHEWVFATGLKTPPVLQVKSWEKSEKCWILDDMSTTGNGGLFSAKDFEPYTTPFTEVRFVETGKPFRRYSIDGVEVFRLWEVVFATNWWFAMSKWKIKFSSVVRPVYCDGYRLQAYEMDFGNLIEEIK